MRATHRKAINCLRFLSRAELEKKAEQLRLVKVFIAINLNLEFSSLFFFLGSAVLVDMEIIS